MSQPSSTANLTTESYPLDSWDRNLDSEPTIPTYQVATLLHEVRNPITTVRTLVKLLQKRLDPEDPNLWITTRIEQECQHLQGLLQQFEQDLDWLAAPELDSIPAPTIDIVEFLTALGSTYEVIADSLGIQFSLEWDPQQTYPPLQINPTTLRQILGNLIDNSYKYTPAGGQVQVGLHQTSDRVILEIKDTGQGISAPELEHIFDRYYRADLDKPGKGLGLAIAKNLIQQIGGTIEVESQVGVGSVFRLGVPIQP